MNGVVEVSVLKDLWVDNKKISILVEDYFHRSFFKENFIKFKGLSGRVVFVSLWSLFVVDNNTVYLVRVIFDQIFALKIHVNFDIINPNIQDNCVEVWFCFEVFKLLNFEENVFVVIKVEVLCQGFYFTNFRHKVFVDENLVKNFL